MNSIQAPQLCDTSEPPAPGSYSTDQGNVTQVVPGFHPVYTIPTKNGASNHTKEFANAAITDEAHKATIVTSKGMAGTAWKILTDEKFAKEVREEFERDRKEEEII